MPYFINKLKQRIAYKTVKGRGLGIIFIHGLNSDMNGKKALTVEKYAQKNKLNFVRFDCRGHGNSDGKFEDFTISDWKKDLVNVIDNLTRGPQILIGSSMGGWVMMLAARVRPSRIKGMIGLAAAPDFGDNLYNNLTIKNKREIKNKGIIKYSSFGFSYFIRKKFFIDAKKNKVLNKPYRYNKPLILIHGLKDNVVSSKVPKKILKKVTSKKIQIMLLKNSDHRLSSKKDLQTLMSAIDIVRYD
ncbi:uncharacterized protein METZ01_LOCUS62742 [marine metagenome]|uniref:Palmitoyl-protein thioesterase ABHD10, mitochondrial n=1 Tax=marine metagenome TaxID=408172 RepID=A0A381T2T5_9ZZZZ